MEVQMQALSSLTREHQMISSLTGALERYATRLREGAPLVVADLSRFAAVFRELVDFRHHEKEEGILLPLLARNGFAWNEGPLSDIRREHRHLRYLIDVLCQAAAKHESDAARSSQEDRWQIAGAALAFVDFKRGHMHKENTLLFPAISERLNTPALERLENELRHFDEMTGQNPRSAQIWQLAEELIQSYAEPEDGLTADSRERPGLQPYVEARYGT
jgi:hemerythrin-like domain-containing protein